MTIAITKVTVKAKSLTFACIMYTFDILGDYFYICGAMECGKMNKLNKLTNISCILDYATSKNEI